MPPSSYSANGRCRLCSSAIQIDVRSGKVYPHRRADARTQCSESGKPRYRPGAPTELLHELKPSVITRRPPRPVSTILEVPVPRPAWVPSLDDADAPVITLPAHGRLGYWVPGHGWQKHEEFVHRHVHGRARPEWDHGGGSWSLATRHFIELAGVLVKQYGRILLGREYNSSESCNPRCMNASGYECTCSCLARNHGRGGWMSGWRITAETTSLVHGRHWSWTVLTRSSSNPRS